MNVCSRAIYTHAERSDGARGCTDQNISTSATLLVTMRIGMLCVRVCVCVRVYRNGGKTSLPPNTIWPKGPSSFGVSGRLFVCLAMQAIAHPIAEIIATIRLP